MVHKEVQVLYVFKCGLYSKTCEAKILKIVVWSKSWWRIFKNALKKSESLFFR